MGPGMDASENDPAANPRRRLLWISAARALAESVAPQLAARGVDVEVRVVEVDLERTTAALIDATPAHDLVVCDCGGERGYERAFFSCRAAGSGSVLLLAVGEDVDETAAEVLMAGVIKALPAARVAMLSDRVAEIERPSGGATAVPWGPEELAASLVSIVESSPFRPGARFRVREAPG